ncbi:MAG: LptF/LptG family permease, partial [bacterium]
ESASWLGDSWIFKDGIIYLLAEKGEYKHLIKFGEQKINIKYSPKDLTRDDRSPEDMNTKDLQSYIQTKNKMGVDTTDLSIQMHMKLAIPFASLVFALLGVPLGLRPHRNSSSIGLGISIIVIFAYYVISFLSMAVGELGIFSPPLAAWMPNILTGAIGFYLLRGAAD